MDFSQFAGRLREKLTRFSGELCGRLGKTASRFVVEAVYGIISSQSVMLTEMGRSLEEDVSLKKIEERFCRQLAKPRLWERLQWSLLSQAASKISEGTLLILDLSDIQKKYARKMEYVTDVRDGSQQVIGKGYWTCQVVGTDVESSQIVPLYQALYSQDSPQFSSENNEVLKAVSLVSSYTGNRGVWVIDRGGDRGRLFGSLLKEDHQFIVRLVGNRHLLYRNTPALAWKLALSCACPYQDTLVREEEGRERAYQIRYGFLPVRLPDYPQTSLWLLVVKGLGSQPLMLLTTIRLRRSAKVLKRVLFSYLRRWSIEETIRFIKQTYDLENIRVLRYSR
ncbi:unnamed protein product [marine sediment metagenome]|uniref:Transposase IS4-like domain-containing protein n=1 Tax=marine sediment metagenome TaxID=412755 RepID=X0YN50_9ZZZZ